MEQNRGIVDGAGETHEVVDYYFHQDDLFNVVLVTDESGDAVERYEYGDYGAPFYYDAGGSSISYSVLNNTRLFNGREWDQDTRFYYYRTRYMEPTMGRFTTRDTIGVWGDALNRGNGVAYVGNRPWSSVDPFGLAGKKNDPFYFIPKSDKPNFIPWFHHDYEPTDPEDIISEPGRRNPDRDIKRGYEKWKEEGRPRPSKPKGWKKRGGGGGGGAAIIITAIALLDGAPRLLEAGECKEYFDRLNDMAKSGECDIGALEIWRQPCAEQVQDELGLEAWDRFEQLHEDVRDKCNCQ